MSGGVDSSVAVALLKEEGHEVAGATIRTWASGNCADQGTKACCGITGVEDARDVANTLGIPYWVFNFEKEFKKHVIDYFASEYLKGRTPNPCMACNEHIKFRLFLKRAKEMGFDGIATGHYASLAQDEKGEIVIAEGVDGGKDQSYVLFPLDQEVLSCLYLPLGKYTKAEIRAKAKELNLCVMNKPDSQEICFIPDNDYGRFMKEEYSKESEEALKSEGKGVVRMKDGTVLGEHEGFFHYTRGQRRGLKIPYKEKLYVVETKKETNEVIVGTKKDILGSRFLVGRVNWFSKPDEEKLSVDVKIRSQHGKGAATLQVLDDDKVQIEFQDPQEAITPGQAAVFYRGAEVLGGGWIDEVFS